MLTVPLLSNVPVPSEVVPLKNWTVPVGVPVPGLAAVTVAVSVTDAPEADGLGTTTMTVGRVGFRDRDADGRRGAARERAVARVDRRERWRTHDEAHGGQDGRSRTVQGGRCRARSCR